MSDTLSKYQKETRPWGNFERFTLNEPTTVKILTLNPEQEFSLQKHGHRAEFWCVIAGSGTVTVGEQHSPANIGDQFLVPESTPHRALASQEGLRILEIAFGEFSEDDIKRIEDDYGRV